MGVLKMKAYKLEQKEKFLIINRCFFDAEHGWQSLTLERLKYLHKEFPNDPQIDYAEALIRQDFLGEGIKAEELFIRAQNHAIIKDKSNENYLFSTFNAVKFSRNEDEFRRHYKIAYSIAPDDSDILVFNQILDALNKGVSFQEILMSKVIQLQNNYMYGESACFADIALNSGDYCITDEISLRKIRINALRELDKAAEASRAVRGESYPPEERLALIYALKELELALNLDPNDHMLWNYKSAWLCLMEKYNEAIECAEKSIELCPYNYFRPRTNKALCLYKLDKKNEAKLEVKKILEDENILNIEFNDDRALTLKIQHDLNSENINDATQLSILSEDILNGIYFTTRQAINQYKFPRNGEEIFEELNNRIMVVGQKWNMTYIEIMEEMLIYFCPELVCLTVMKLNKSNKLAYEHCQNSLLFLAAYKDGIIQRDSCRCILYMILWYKELDIVRKIYRETILGFTAVGPDKFILLENNMRSEIKKFNHNLLNLIADQPPLNQEELDFARSITLSRFKSGSSDSQKNSDSFLKNFINKLLLRKP